MNLFIYKNANIHTHDKIPEFVGTTPFCQTGIQKHCNIVKNPDSADFFYMGQVSDGNIDDPVNILTEQTWTFLPERELQHIMDLEGDFCDDKRFTACGYGRTIAPDWALKPIKSCAPTKYVHWKQPIMARPHVSQLLIFLSQNPECDIEFPDEISFGFRGQAGPLPTRTRLANLFKKSSIKNEIVLNADWGGRKGLDSPAVTNYIDSLYRNLISLCPESSCSATIRFYETCFFARVPVIVGEQMVMEEGDYDTSFIFKVNPKCTDEELLSQFQKIADSPYSELIEKARAARQYFMDVVVKYFQDPTAYMINWMQKKGLYVK